MTKSWEDHRETIVGEYKEQNKPLHEVKKIMEEKYSFKASTRAYRSRLDRWGVHKYARGGRRRDSSGSEPMSNSDDADGGSSRSESPDSGDRDNHRAALMIMDDTPNPQAGYSLLYPMMTSGPNFSGMPTNPYVNIQYPIKLEPQEQYERVAMASVNLAPSGLQYPYAQQGSEPLASNFRAGYGYSSDLNDDDAARLQAVHDQAIRDRFAREKAQYAYDQAASE
ncbi:Clr5 domain-containing protein [Bombardia bombarda]|uniref:Clr5 domain-containing protein n=1 Tax=Bombardia bombarda TaxID=252184 RepID=A0AA39X896_9PEZI|nr:Clr5 domain-containing protein [Bombardia bombarda]